MKNTFFYTLITLLFLLSCKKENLNLKFKRAITLL